MDDDLTSHLLNVLAQGGQLSVPLSELVRMQRQAIDQLLGQHPPQAHQAHQAPQQLQQMQQVHQQASPAQGHPLPVQHFLGQTYTPEFSYEPAPQALPVYLPEPPLPHPRVLVLRDAFDEPPTASTELAAHKAEGDHSPSSEDSQSTGKDTARMPGGQASRRAVASTPYSRPKTKTVRRKLVCCDFCHSRDMTKYCPQNIVWFRSMHDSSRTDASKACDICGGGLGAPAASADVTGYVCLICNQKFGRGDRLVAHSAGHTGVKPFFCAQCPRTFARLVRLEEHCARFHNSTAQ